MTTVLQIAELHDTRVIVLVELDGQEITDVKFIELEDFAEQMNDLCERWNAGAQITEADREIVNLANALVQKSITNQPVSMPGMT